MKAQIRIHNVEQGTDAWDSIRDGLYTGSNADKLIKFGTIDYSRTQKTNFKGNFYTERGHILEDEAIDIYQSVTLRTVSRPGFVTNSGYPQCGYSPDGVDPSTFAAGPEQHEGYLLEVKCFKEDKHMAIFNGDIPLKVLAQIHFGMLVTGLREARLIIYNPDLEVKFAFKIIDIKYNRAIQNNFKRVLGGGN